MAGWKGRSRTESFKEKVFRYRGVIFVVSIPILLIVAVISLMPRVTTNAFDTLGTAGGSSLQDKSHFKYAVIFDAGSTGSRVHVYCFDANTHLHEMLVDGRPELELFKQVKPGLSSFADNLEGVRGHLTPLLEAAVAIVPHTHHKSTPIALKATAGLRLLRPEQAEGLLEAVRTLFAEYPFHLKPDAVSILDGTDEGAFGWVSVNYLLGRLSSGELAKTVGLMDLGGGSVQIVHAIPDEAAQLAPDTGGAAVLRLHVLGQPYNVYVHSYLGYGLMAARAALLEGQAADESGSPCMPRGYNGSYVYASKEIPAHPSRRGSSFSGCSAVARAVVRAEAECLRKQVDELARICAFNGVWSPGGVTGTAEFYLASYFYERAQQTGVMQDPQLPLSAAKVADYAEAGEAACGKGLDDINRSFPLLDAKERPFLCLDLTYLHTLLSNGFGALSCAVLWLGVTVCFVWAWQQGHATCFSWF
eukprot:jgi/Mesvir1/17890/Mv12961-RA.2